MAKSDQKRGLGRGLSALMSDVVVETPSSQLGAGAANQSLPIESIKPNPDQPRRKFNDDDMQDLIASISAKGIIQPLVVRPMKGDTYQLVAGERRWRAAQAAQLHEVPVVIREFTDLEVIEVAIIENIQRADLNPIEEAAGYRQLMDTYGHTQEQMATALGKSRSHIANLLRLLQLPASVVSLVEDGKLSAGHARALITADDPEAIAKKIIAAGLSVRATEALVKKQNAGDDSATSKTPPKAATPEKDADTRALEGDLSAATGMKIAIDHAPGNDGGTMTIRYRSLDQLDELCRALSGG